MYGWLWRTFRGPFLLKALQAGALLAVVVSALFLWAFPWVESRLPYSEVTVPGPASTSEPTGQTTEPTGQPSELPAE